MNRHRSSPRYHTQRRSGYPCNWREFSLFINNLPPHTNRAALYNLFRVSGRITDTYIPIQQSRRTGKKFGFVRFDQIESAKRAISSLHSRSLHGFRVEVSFARFQKRSIWSPTLWWEYQANLSRGEARKPIDQNYNRTCQTKFNAKITKGIINDYKEGEQMNIFVVKGEISKSIAAWLQRTLSCRSLVPLNRDSMYVRLQMELPFFFKLVDMGPYQILIGFASKEDMELAGNEYGSFLRSWFTEVREWHNEDT